MAFTNKRFSKEDKKAIIEQIVKSEEIQDIMKTAIETKLQEALETVPEVTKDGENLVVTFKADGIEKSYTLNEVAVAITETEQKDITVFEDHPSPN